MGFFHATPMFAGSRPFGLAETGTTATSGNSLVGSLVAVSIGYTMDTPPVINNVVEVVAGTVVAYSAAGAGTVSFPPVTTPPPGSGGNGQAPTVLLKIGNNNFFAPAPTGALQVRQSPFQVDASGSTDPNNLPLTYSWSSDRPVAFVPGPNAAAPNIQFGSGSGDYRITVTITNSEGVSTTASFTLSYFGSGI
jgi:hypothetical protein